MKVGRIEQLTHTPGPWTAQDYEPPFWVEPPDANQPVICDLVSRKEGESTDEDAANARLIAAAPDLLKALHWLGAMYDGELCFCQMAVGNPMVREHSAVCANARAAVAKAEGKS